MHFIYHYILCLSKAVGVKKRINVRLIQFNNDVIVPNINFLSLFTNRIQC